MFFSFFLFFFLFFFFDVFFVKTIVVLVFIIISSSSSNDSTSSITIIVIIIIIITVNRYILIRPHPQRPAPVLTHCHVITCLTNDAISECCPRGNGMTGSKVDYGKWWPLARAAHVTFTTLLIRYNGWHLMMLKLKDCSKTSERSVRISIHSIIETNEWNTKN